MQNFSYRQFFIFEKLLRDARTKKCAYGATFFTKAKTYLVEKAFTQKTATLALSVLISLSTMPVYALPAGSNVVEGNIQIDGATPNQLHIQQQTDKGIINWQSFNIGEGELTEFHQPDGSSITLNRVVGGDLSSILGTLKANGKIFLVNPNGVIFGSGSVVDVGGLVATTTDIDNEDFINGQFVFDTPGNQNAKIVNQGVITATEGGLIALVAPQVVNNGVLQARLGKISLASGNKYTLDLYGDELIQLAVNDTVATSLQTQIENNGSIDAEGGMVVLAASQATEVLDSVINMDGIIQANSASEKDGKIILSGGASGLVRVNGDVSAQGGGGIDILGDTIVIRENAYINTSGANSGGVIHIGGEYQGSGDKPTASHTGVAQGATIQANATQNGDGGEVIIWADESTAFYGDISAEGGTEGGNGGFVEVSGKETLVFNGGVSTRAPNGEMGTLLLDPTDITIINGGGGADDAQVTGDGIILGPDGGAVPFTISENALEGIAAGTNINVQATNDITINDLADDELGLATLGAVLFQADSDSSGAGTFSMNTGDRITTQGASIQLGGNAIVAGELDTSAGAGGAIILNSTGGGSTIYGDITTDAGAISINGATVLGNNVNVAVGAGVGNILVGDTIDGAFNLTLNAGTGSIIVSDNFGGITPLNSFTTAGVGITLQDVTTSLGQTYNAPLNLGGTLTTAGTNILFNNTVDLTAASGADTGAGAGNITFTTTLDGAEDFTASAGLGNVSYGGVVGGVTPLANISTSGANITMAGNVVTSSDQTYNGATVISQNMTSGGAITFTGSATLGANRIITSGGGVGDDIVFNVAVAEDFDLTLNAGGAGDISIGDVDVNSLTLTGDTLNVTGDVVSDVALTFAGVNAINATGTGSLTAFDVADEDITFGVANVLGGGGNLTLNGDTITVEQVAGVGNFAINANTAIVLNDSVSTVGTQTYTGPAISLDQDLTTTNDNILFNNAINLTGPVIMDTGAGIGNITFSGAVNGAQNLTVDAGTGNVIALADIGGVTPLTTYTATGANISGLAITTTGNQTYTGIASFTGAMATNAAGDIDVTGNLTAGSTISADTTGNINVTGDLDATGTVTSGSGDITVGGITTINDTVSTTGGNINLSGGMALAASPLLVSTGAGAGNISLAGAVDGASDLTLTAGTGSVTSTGAIGGVTPLLSLTASGSGGISLADVSTVAGQTYTGNTTINGDWVTVNSNIGVIGTLAVAGTSTMSTGAGAGNVTLSSTVNGANSLGINTGTGDTVFSGDVGDVTPLTSLSVTSDDITTENVVTTGAQTYTGTTNVTFNQALNATAGGITASGTTIDTQAVTSTGNQVYNSTGDTTFNGTVTVSAGTLGVTADNIDAQIVTTSGDQTYNATTNATFNQTLTATVGGVNATATTIDTQAVTTAGNQVYNSTGDTTFNNTITTTVGTLDVTADNISAQLVNTAGTQTYNATTALLFNQDIQATAGGVDATAGTTIDTQAVTTTGNQVYNSTGDTTFFGTLAASAGTLDVTADNISAQIINTSGDQTYNATTALLFNQDIQATAGGVNA
jgi:filamentous hemagglutinin family protein